MIRVMIVDDELLVRVGLRSVLDWEKYGFTVAAEASNGLEAYRLLHTRPVDVVLLDIKMPEMDGLMLLEKLKAEGNPVKVIILSCHNEFDMVRSALRLGASDYVPKLSINPQALLDILRSACPEAAESRTDAANREAGEDWLALCNGYSGEIWARLRGRSPLDPDNIRVLVVRVDSLEDSLREGGIPDADRFMKALRALLIEIAEPHGRSVVVPGSKRRLILLYSGARGEEGLRDLCAAVSESFRTYFDRTVSIGLSKGAVGITHLSEGCASALRALGRGFFTGPSSLLTDTGEPSRQEDEIRDAEAVVRALTARRYEEASAMFYRWIGGSSGQRSRSGLLMGLEEIFLCLHRLQASVGAELFTESPSFAGAAPSEEPVTSALHRFSFFSELQEWSASLFEAYLARLAAQPGYVMRSEIQTVLRLIEERYAEKLELAAIAGAVNMNPSYLSNLFKRETGKGLVEHLTEFRMTKAGELLCQTDCHVGEAARLVGYDNIFYFSRVFKRFFGQSPSDYKLIQKKDKEKG